MRKTSLLILLVAALIGCPPPGEDELFNNINIADWVCSGKRRLYGDRQGAVDDDR